MEDSTMNDNRETTAESRETAEKDDEGHADELVFLKRQRGYKAAAVTRACNTADAMLARHPSSDEIEKRKEMLNAELDAFMEAHDAYVAKLDDMDEIEEAGQCATRITARHTELFKRIEECMKPPQEVAPSEQVGSRIAGSHVSRDSRDSVTSKEAEITAKMKALELKHLKAKKERERQMRKQAEERESQVRKQAEEMRKQAEEREREMRKQVEEREREMRKQAEETRRQEEDMLEEKALEDEVERAFVEARLWKAVENELEWERRHDFVDEAAVGEESQRLDNSGVSREKDRQKLASNGKAEPRRDSPLPETVDVLPITKGASRNISQNTSNWVTELSSETRRNPQGPSAFVKSIPRLTLPTFRGSAQEWPRWIGLFKALVHDQPSLSDAERMAHLQSAVEGPAAQAIDGMLFSGDLYHEALKTLQERFGREESIVQAHLQKIFMTSSPSLTDLPAMEKFGDTVHNSVTVLRNLGYTNDLSSSDNLRRVVEKLPTELARDWGREVFRLRPARPTLEIFSKWLQVQVSILSFSVVQPGNPERMRAAVTERDSPAQRTALLTGVSYEAEEPRARPLPPCTVCGDKHKVADCSKFKVMSLKERREVVYGEGLCFSCLRKGHWSKKCRSSQKCGTMGCNYTHHPLLHQERKLSKVDEDDKRKENRKTPSSAGAARESHVDDPRHQPFVAASVKTGTDTLLQIVTIRVHGPRESADVLALLDAGAQTSLCCEGLLKELDITGERRPLCIQNVETSGEKKQSERVQLTVSPLGTGRKKTCINIPEVWSVPTLNVCAATVTNRQLQEWHHLRGLEFPQYDGGQIKLLVGANVLEAVSQKEVRVGRPNQPAAVKTEFGWTLTGTASGVVPSSTRQVMFLKRKPTEDDERSAVVNLIDH